MKDNRSTVAVSAGNKAFIFWRVRETNIQIWSQSKVLIQVGTAFSLIHFELKEIAHLSNSSMHLAKTVSFILTTYCMASADHGRLPGRLDPELWLEPAGIQHF